MARGHSASGTASFSRTSTGALWMLRPMDSSTGLLEPAYLRGGAGRRGAARGGEVRGGAVPLGRARGQRDARRPWERPGEASEAAAAAAAAAAAQFPPPHAEPRASTCANASRSPSHSARGARAVGAACSPASRPR
eukprot:355915-Chlamydomonas_euryale.AAC.5